MAEKPIYLCYAPADKDFVEKMKKRLLASEYVVNDAPQSATDKGLDKATRTIIDSAQCVLVIVSNALYTNRQSVWELRYAIDIKKRWIPVAVETPLKEGADAYFKNLSDDLQEEWVEAFHDDFSVINTEIHRLNWVRFDIQPKPDGTTDTEKQFEADYRTLQQAISSPKPVFYNAFISYSRLNSDVVRAFKSHLEEAFYRLWFDANGIPKARPWLDEIKAGIDQSNNCLLFVSSSWLGSGNCDEEWDYAVQRSKRIIPIFFAEPDVDDNGELTAGAALHEPNLESALRVFDARRRLKGDWNQMLNVSEENVRKYFEGRLEKLRALDPVVVPHHFLTSQPGKIDNAFFSSEVFRSFLDRLKEDSDYLTEHTQLLVKAVAYEQGVGDPLTFSEWRKESKWLKQHRSHIPPPAELHLEFIRRSRQAIMLAWASRGLIGAIILSIIGFLLAAFAQSNAALAEQEVENQLALNAEITNRFQTVAQAAEQQAIDLDGQPRRPLLVNNALWVSLGDHVQPITLDGVFAGERVITGTDARTPFFDRQFIWVVGADTLTRIDPTGRESPISLSIGADLSDPMFIDDWIWIHSGLSNTLTRIRRGDVKIDVEISLSPDEQIVIPGGGYLWSWDNDRLRRVSATGEELFFDGFGEIYSVAFAENRLWMAAGGKLHRIDPATGTAEISTTEIFNVEAPLITNGMVWAIARAVNTVYGFDAQTLQMRQQINITSPNRLFYTENRLWVFTGSDEVNIYDTSTNTHQLLSKLSLPGSNRISTLVTDPDNLWITPADQGTVFVVRKSNGALYREFQPCEGRVLPPVYDGASMWFACPDSNQLVSMPASLYFFGERTIQRDTDTHRPVAWGQYIWMTQQATGRLLVYDTIGRRGMVAADFDGTLLPLINDQNGYLWTAVASSGELIRISPQAFSFTTPTESDYLQRLPLNHSVYGLYLVESAVWALHDDTDNQSSNYSVITRESEVLQLLHQERLTLVPMGMTYAEGYVWMPVSTMTEGNLYRIDAETGLNPTLIDIPDTDFGAWPGMRIDEGMWFSVVVPPTDQLIQQLAGMMLPGNQLDTSPFLVRRLNTRDSTWGQRWPLPGSTAGAVWDGEYLWYTLLTAPSVPVIGEQESGIGKFALRLEDGAIIPENPGGWTFCEYSDPTDGQRRFGTTGNMYLVGDLLFSGCLDNAEDVAVFSREPSPRLLTVHHDVGLAPWDPVSDGETVWMTFRDSDNAAVFDAQTGELLRIIDLQNQPAPPLILGDSLWVYHPGDDVLQQLALRP